MLDVSLAMLCFLLLVGLLLGGVFFGGLLWTVRAMSSAKRPVLLFVFSFVVRLTVLLVGLYFLGQESWQRYVAMLLGVLIARTLLLRYSRSSAQVEVEHAA